jgi:hypothetical protein
MRVFASDLTTIVVAVLGAFFTSDIVHQAIRGGIISFSDSRFGRFF